MGLLADYVHRQTEVESLLDFYRTIYREPENTKKLEETALRVSSLRPSPNTLGRLVYDLFHNSELLELYKSEAAFACNGKHGTNHIPDNSYFNKNGQLILR